MKVTLHTHPGRWYEFRRGFPPPDSFDAARGEGYSDGWVECWDVCGFGRAVGFVTESEVKVFAAGAVRSFFATFPEEHCVEARKVSPRIFFERLLSAIAAAAYLKGFAWEPVALGRVVKSIPASLTWDEVYPGESWAVTHEKEESAG